MKLLVFITFIPCASVLIATIRTLLEVEFECFRFVAVYFAFVYFCTYNLKFSFKYYFLRFTFKFFYLFLFPLILLLEKSVGIAMIYFLFSDLKK